jgi:phage recombination protein Bet
MSDDPKEENAVAVRPEQAIQKKSLIATMADRYGIGTDQFFETIQQTIMPSAATKAQTAAFLIVCNRYGFDPFLRQIYAFPTKGGGIVPVVGVDGWLDIMNSNPQYDGDEYLEIREGGKLIGATVTIYRKDRSRPLIHSEYFEECKRNTDPWTNMPRRMMKNRTYVQAIRRAFGVAGIMDPEEAEALREINITDQSVELERTTNKATENLKETIAQGIATAKEKIKKKKETENPTAPIIPLKVPERLTLTPVEPPHPVEARVPTEDEVRAAAVASVGASLPFTDTNLAEDDDLEPKVDQDAVISDLDRNDLLSILKAAPGVKETKQMAIKQKLVSLGYSNTKEIKYRHYQGLVAWAKQTTF